MDRFKSKEEAEDLIKRTLKRDEKFDDGKINSKRIEINHLEKANEILKIINVCPVSNTVKKVFNFKLFHPGISDLQIALACGIREDDVMKYEAEGKYACKKFLEHHNAQHAINKFNIDEIAMKELKNIQATKVNANPGIKKGPPEDIANL